MELEEGNKIRMERVNRIIKHPLYLEYMAKIKAWEKDRVFCRHDGEHFLAVARIAALLNSEEQYGIDREEIYAAALLHDIGRFLQYENGEDHALASAYLAPQILKDCGFADAERERIVSAIETHRSQEVMERRNLNGLLYRADKLSRPCFFCQQEENCDWKADKKNLSLLW